MRQMGIVILGIVFLFLGHINAYSLPQGLGIPGTLSSYDQAYAEYSQVIRVKIGTSLQKKLTVLEQGMVSLDLEISSDGKLIKLRVNDDKTKASELMISNAIMAVKDSAPFNPFPPVLSHNNDKLPFNIYLSLKKQ